MPYCLENDKKIVYSVQFGLPAMVLGIGKASDIVGKGVKSSLCSNSEGSNYFGEKLKGK